ncbi:hypothetical protein DPMN_000518 [Dreissena polymorpha]|uniref:Uncharacterized protein n=1 Tax=Dreissena polymorpha TaxID=45954 RepID=A0A9D4MIA8_DREPO|nr:hypothetical protein DPMN_000518 [Dreissena polymorpha]
MSSCENYENVKQLNDRLCDNFETLKCVHQECVSLCTDSVTCEDLSKSFESSRKNFDEFQERISQWLVADEKAPDDDKIPSVSRVSTTASSRSNLRNARAKRLLAEHKMRTLREKHRLEQEQHVLEQEKRVLEQEQRVLEHKRQMLEHESEVEGAHRGGNLGRRNRRRYSSHRRCDGAVQCCRPDVRRCDGTVQ